MSNTLVLSHLPIYPFIVVSTGYEAVLRVIRRRQLVLAFPPNFVNLPLPPFFFILCSILFFFKCRFVAWRQKNCATAPPGVFLIPNFAVFEPFLLEFGRFLAFSSPVCSYSFAKTCKLVLRNVLRIVNHQLLPPSCVLSSGQQFDALSRTTCLGGKTSACARS